MAHLSGFGLENFRVFKDYTWFDFAPITILVGPNSSGKSSLIKALLLLKDNYEKRNLSNLDDKYRYAKYLRFDGLEHNISSGVNVAFVEKNQLSFTVPYALTGFSKKTLFKFSYRIQDNQTIVDSEEEIIDADNNLIFSRKSDGSIFFDYLLFLKLVNPGLKIAEGVIERRNIPQVIDDLHQYIWGENLQIPGGKPSIVWTTEGSNEVTFDTELEKWYKNISELNNFDKHSIISSEFFNKSINFKEFFPEWPMTKLTAFVNEEDLEYEDDRGAEIYSSLFGLELIFRQNNLPEELAKSIHNLLELKVNSKKILLSSLNEIIYIPPVRGNVKRGFQNSEHNPLNEMLKSVSFFDEEYGLGKEKEFLNKWGKIFGFQDLEICRNEELDINYLKIGNKTVLDVGYGLSQISTVLLVVMLANRQKGLEELFDLSKYKVLILEEPETSLHPKYQSLLADVFVEAKKRNQFIIETHSEYMIRKFQYLVAKGEMKPEDIVIYYFNDPNNIPVGEKQVKKINVLEDGSLSDDFGPGFYDEAANWELKLLKLKKNKTRQN